MGRCEFRTVAFDISARFTNDLDIADYRGLRKLAREEIVLAHVRRMAQSAQCPEGCVLSKDV
jgi:hypothetical protein